MTGAQAAAYGYIERLRNLDSCVVCDALDRLGLAGAATGIPHRSGGAKIAGRVITVRLETGTPPGSGRKHLGTTAVESGGPDTVIVIEQRTGIDAGCWGGLLTAAAQSRGIPGIIADGPVRDIDEAVESGFSIFSTALTSLTARGRIHEAGTNIPVTIRGVSVNPGDYVIADRSAAVFVNAEDVARVLDIAESIQKKEMAMLESISSGNPVGVVMDGRYENMLKNGES